MAPRISRFRTESVLRKPVREREKTMTNVTGDRMSTFVARRLKYMNILVMNASTTTCMVNHPITTGIIRSGISDKLNDYDQSERYSSRETYNLTVQASMLQAMPRINEGIASRMTMLYRNLLLVKRHILLRNTDSISD
jgi:hypothetical protein